MQSPESLVVHMIGWGDSRPCFLAMAVVVGPEVVVVNLVFVRFRPKSAWQLIQTT
jgi:hypothetical protein